MELDEVARANALVLARALNACVACQVCIRSFGMPQVKSKRFDALDDVDVSIPRNRQVTQIRFRASDKLIQMA